MQLTVRDVAKLLNVSEKTIYRWVTQGTLPTYRVKDQYRFSRAEVLQWATSRHLNPVAELLSEPETRSLPMPSLMEALQSGGIYYRVSGSDKPSALRGVVENMRLPEEVDREYLLKVLLAREELASTGIGDGIALPHVRSPIILHVSRPLLSLCFLETPVDFNALDGHPVHALFALVSPSVRTHLHLLSRLAFALRDAGLKRALKNVGLREEILGELRRVESALPHKETVPEP